IIKNTQPQWKRARVVIGDFCADTDASASKSKEEGAGNMGTPSKLKVKRDASDLTPRKAASGLLKRLH
ncbi:hypothetical protein HDU98_012159, partial [Podochytrium sp. JEL0797]